MRGSLQVGTDGDDLCVPGATHVVGNESRGSNGFVRGVDGARSGEEVLGTEGVTGLGCGEGMVGTLGVVVLENVAGLVSLHHHTPLHITSSPPAAEP